MSGDKNPFDEKQILAVNPNFRQIMTKNTRNRKILTILITDLHTYYHEPQIFAPIPVDVPGQGSRSDHSGVLALPVMSAKSQRESNIRKVKICPLPESLICKLGDKIVTEEWNFLKSDMPSTELDEKFQGHTQKLMEGTFPEKSVKF